MFHFRRLIQFTSFVLSIFACQALYLAPTAYGDIKEVTIAQFGKEKFLLYLPLYIAMEEGIFEKNGVKINLKFAGNDNQIFATVMSGDAMFGVGDPVLAAISREKGFEGKVVGLMLTKLGLSGYTKDKSLPVVSKPSDLTGLRISSFQAPSTTYTLLSELIKNNQPQLERTKLVQVAVGGHLAALEAGQVDIAVDLEPNVSIAEDKGYRVIFGLSKFTEPQAITGITTLEETIKKNPDTVKAVITSLQQALNILHTDKEVGIRTAKKLFPQLSDTVLSHAVGRMMSEAMYPESIAVADDLWQRTLKTRLDSGELKKPQATEVTVDNQFAVQR